MCLRLDGDGGSREVEPDVASMCNPVCHQPFRVRKEDATKRLIEVAIKKGIPKFELPRT